MRRLGTVSTLTVFGAMSALLAGCPIWGPEMGGVRDGGDAGVVPTSCNTNADCSNNEYCNLPTRQCVAANPCTGGAGCQAGYYCDGRNVCVPGCSTNMDCASASSLLVCNPASHRCEPGGGCSASNPCPSGQSCVAGSCRATNTLCRFNYECGAGQECVDGRCLAACRAGADAGASACPSPQVCRDGYCQYPAGGTCDCNERQVCANNVCLPVCSRDADCTTAGQFCDNGVCRVDDRRPAPFCTPPANGCAAGSICIDGVCRISCPMRTSEECQRRDVNFNSCDTNVMPTPICRYSNETMPQCQRNSDCAAGQVCVNAICR